MQHQIRTWHISGKTIRYVQMGPTRWKARIPGRHDIHAPTTELLYRKVRRALHDPTKSTLKAAT